MAGPFAIAGVQALGSILGGVFGKTKAVTAGDSFRSQIGGVMDMSKKFGINPLTLLNVPSPGFSPGDNSSMGAGIADAAMFLGDALSKKTDAAKLQQVAAERDRLQTQVQSLTIRPKFGGPLPMLRLSGKASPYAAPARSSTGGPASYAGSRTVGVDAVAPDLTNTYRTFENEGQTTDVPVGPDLDEVISGAVIATVNKRKADQEFRTRPNMEFGTPLSVPFGFGNRAWELMPPTRPVEKKKPLKRPSKPAMAPNRMSVWK